MLTLRLHRTGLSNAGRTALPLLLSWGDEMSATHDYEMTECAEWSDTFTCKKCGASHTYAAEDGVKKEWLNRADTSPCVLPNDNVTGTRAETIKDN